MDPVLIAFDHQGKYYKGQFAPVMGAGGSSVFHLMIDNYYCGRLRYTDRWVFDPTPKTGSFVELTEYFGDYVTAWYG